MVTQVRKARKDDVPEMLALIKELAVYEKAEHEVEVTVEELLRDGFGTNPLYHSFVALANERIIGLALYYFKYSTWKGRCLYLEDLVVNMEYRKKGVGSALFLAVAQVAKTKQVKRMEWQVLDWNKSAIAFYRKHKAELDAEWINGRLRYAQLQKLQDASGDLV